MRIAKGIIATDLFLYLESHKTFIISDIHVGYEESLQRRGAFLPKGNVSELRIRIEKAMSGKEVERVILNGDLLHDFGRVLKKERAELNAFLVFLEKKAEVIIIRGNHDKVLSYILPDMKVIPDFVIGDILVTHGDMISSHTDDKKIKTIIIGHEHPSITLDSGLRQERYKCFLKGKYKGKKLIVMPSCNLLLEGADVMREKLLSPYLSDISDFEAYITEDKIYDFGKLRKLKKI